MPRRRACPRPHDRPGPRCPGLRPLTVAAVLVAAGLLLWAGCTVTPENYKLLSMLFDGVPDPSMTGPSGNMAGFDISQSPTYSLHQPFAEEKCDDCHKVGLQPSRNDSAICLPCHEQVPTQHRFTHGPVAAGACMWCHAPHESAHAALMRDVDRKVCAQCHTPAMLSSTKVPEHDDPNRACLECHTGHGGEAPYMLRPLSERAAPKPRPGGKPESQTAPQAGPSAPPEPRSPQGPEN